MPSARSARPLSHHIRHEIFFNYYVLFLNNNSRRHGVASGSPARKGAIRIRSTPQGFRVQRPTNYVLARSENANCWGIWESVSSPHWRGFSLLYCTVLFYCSSPSVRVNVSVPALTHPATDTQVQYIYDDIPGLCWGGYPDKTLPFCCTAFLGSSKVHR